MVFKRTIAAVATCFALNGAVVALPAAAQTDAAQAPQAQPANPSAQATPPATPPQTATPLDVYVVNPEDLLDYNKTIVVPTAYVTLLTEGRVTARKQSGMFQRGNASTLASANFKVDGIDKAFAQSLAQKAYDDFVAKLRAAGYTVLTYADIRDRDAIKNAQREKGDGPIGLPAKSESGSSFAIAAPSDEQYFKSALGWGVFAEFVQSGRLVITDATLLIPQYTIAAPQVWGEGSRGYGSVSAEVKVVHGMNLLTASANWMGKPKSRVMRGAPGVQTKQQIINVTEKAGTLQQTANTTPQAANAVSGVLSMLSGAGNIQRSSGNYAFTIDRDAYTAGAMNGISRFNAEVAKAAAEAKP